jgi:predicted nucleotidyltransferase
MYSINELREIVTETVTPYPVTKVIITGSYANNTASETSDIDIVLDGGDLSDAYWEILFLLEDRLKIPVDLITMRGLKNSLLKDSILSGGINLYEA